ncbi:T9SS-dependent choice-of-anchor J family protein [Flavobacterium wongokense]|uniref:T9SS-dependent choice-of-anchor J family protein n=1 Tax=Flavobacterium wongokense TaxID=2910674 RepID=UPI001F448D34|nr:T9SS type A sorting domain-containing protein [Flavobacterium sp. WG47]MCF6133153.1 T9SS type A sorting domain-containing protein [Flavobacterium sp. WG47]
MQKYFRHLVLFVVLIYGINLSNAQTTIFEQSLLSQASFDTFTSINVTGTQNWHFSSSYGAVCSGYTAGQNYENEDWFVSPAMNLAQINNVKLTFNHTRGSANVLNAGVAEGWYKVFATANFTGNPATTQWTELTGFNQNIPTAWQYVSSGDLIIPEAAKSENSRIAFRYLSSAVVSATWEIKNVKVTGEIPVNPNTSLFKITNWNLEWLGCTTFGPTDETLQINNIASAMLAMNSDIYCIQEVTNSVSYPSISTLISLLGSDQWDGRIIPSTTNDCEQRQAIIYKKSRVQFAGASQLNNGAAAQGNSYYYNWSSGRYPTAYNVNLISGANVVPLSIVNIHGKSEDGDAMSYTRRLGGSEALKTILDGAGFNTKNLLLIGDFNDYLIGTSSNACACTDSPYKNFMDDPTDYTGITQFINDAHWNHPLIENIILSNELSGNYVSNSAAQEVTVPPGISNYYNTTSDHLPVSATLQFSTLANQQYAFNALTISPNPVHNELRLDTTQLENNAILQIYDVTGREMHCGRMNANTVNVSSLPSGIYILKADGKFGRFVKE